MKLRSEASTKFSGVNSHQAGLFIDQALFELWFLPEQLVWKKPFKSNESEDLPITSERHPRCDPSHKFVCATENPNLTGGLNSLPLPLFFGKQLRPGGTLPLQVKPLRNICLSTPIQRFLSSFTSLISL